jgi:hypothetical protein
MRAAAAGTRATSFATTLALIVILTPSAALAVKVQTDSDSSIAVSGYRTYAWKSGEMPGLTEQRQVQVERWVQDAVNEELAASGLREVADDPDVYVTFFATTDILGGLKNWGSFDHRRHFGYGASQEYYVGWNAVMSQPDTTGILLIDLVDASSDTLAWRAYCKGTIKPGRPTYEKKIRKAVKLAFKQYPPESARGK